MEKITGQLQGKTLSEILGNTTKVLGISDADRYEEKISKMDLEDLYRHGMETYGIKPSATTNGKKYRKTFESKCVAAFKRKTGSMPDKTIERKLTKKVQREVSDILAKIK